jgi:hypothetical protein
LPPPVINWRERGSRTNNIQEIIADLLDSISRELVHNGHCIFEKIHNQETKELLCLKIISGNTKIKRANVIQTLSKKMSYENKTKRKVYIPKSKCFIIKFPKEVTSEKNYLKMLDTMFKIDSKNPLHSFLKPTNLNKTNGYDFMDHRERLDIILRKLTNPISWHHREQFSNDKFSTYYSTLSDLNFRRTKMLMMQHILFFIKDMTERIFSDAVLSIKYYKKIEDLDRIIHNYKLGEFSSELHTNIIENYSF